MPSYYGKTQVDLRENLFFFVLQIFWKLTLIAMQDWKPLKWGDCILLQKADLKGRYLLLDGLQIMRNLF